MPASAKAWSLAESVDRRGGARSGKSSSRGSGSKVSTAGSTPSARGLVHHPREERPVAAMHAVEAADGDDRVGGAGLRVADDLEVHSCRANCFTRKPSAQRVAK